MLRLVLLQAWPLYHLEFFRRVFDGLTLSDVEDRMIEKATIPKALREQVWIQKAGSVFQRKCFVRWCQNTITVFDFHTGHNVPESKGGATRIDNLVPLCSRCNLSMSNNYTIDEWSAAFEARHRVQSSCLPFWFCCFFVPPSRNGNPEPQAKEARGRSS